MLSIPILNPPQSGVLGMHNIGERPVVQDNEIKVKPIIKSLMPIFLANIEEFDMNLSAPQMRPTSPIERKINDINIDIN